MLNRIEKKSVLLKIVYGVVLGAVVYFYTNKIELTSNASIFISGITFGLFAGLSSVPFNVKKIIYAIIRGLIVGVILSLLNMAPGIKETGLALYLMLPVYGSVMSISIGKADKSSFKTIAGIIGSFVASFISFGLLVAGALVEVSLSWARPSTRWPLYTAFILIGALMLLGIGIGECYKRQ